MNQLKLICHNTEVWRLWSIATRNAAKRLCVPQIPIAKVLQEEWARTFQGAKLDALISETTKALAKGKGIDSKDLKTALERIRLKNYQTNTAPAPI